MTTRLTLSGVRSSLLSVKISFPLLFKILTFGIFSHRSFGGFGVTQPSLFVLLHNHRYFQRCCRPRLKGQPRYMRLAVLPPNASLISRWASRYKTLIPFDLNSLWLRVTPIILTSRLHSQIATRELKFRWARSYISSYRFRDKVSVTGIRTRHVRRV